jgi:hypothetical protein
MTAHPRRALLTEAIQTRDDSGPIKEYFVSDSDLNNIAQGIGLLVCPSKAERSVRPDTLRAHARGTYRRSPTPLCDQCIDPFLAACRDVPCFYTAIRDVTWPRTAFLIGENLVVTARHSLPIGLNLMDDVRIIFGLTYDKLRGLIRDPHAQFDTDDQEFLTIAKYKPGTYKPGPSDRYDWATFEIEVMTPNRGPLKPAKALKKEWISERADDGKPYDLAMLGHPLGLPLTLVRNKTTLSRVFPPGAGPEEANPELPGGPKLPEGMLLASMDSIDGYSGAPVLTQVDQKWHIVGLCVGTAWRAKAADPNVRACALSSGDVVDRDGKGRCRILPAEFFFFEGP